MLESILISVLCIVTVVTTFDIFFSFHRTILVLQVKATNRFKFMLGFNLGAVIAMATILIMKVVK